MKRAALERPRALRTLRQYSALYAPPLFSRHELQSGHFRKSLRIGGCGNSACRLCHAGKLDGYPTLQESRHILTFREQLAEAAI